MGPYVYSHVGKVPTEWYLEIELRRGTSEWSALTASFILTFSFESGFDMVVEALILEIGNALMKEHMKYRHLEIMEFRE